MSNSCVKFSAKNIDSNCQDRDFPRELTFRTFAIFLRIRKICLYMCIFDDIYYVFHNFQCNISKEQSKTFKSIYNISTFNRHIDFLKALSGSVCFGHEKARTCMSEVKLSRWAKITSLS